MIFDLIFYTLIFAVAFYLLIKASDHFVENSSIVGNYLGMSSMMIGVTIVAAGTSLPETLTSLASFFFSDKASEFVIGTTMGSNITNILLALGIFFVLAGNFKAKKKEVFNVFALMLTTLIFISFVFIGYVNALSLLLILFYAYYIYHLYKYNREDLSETLEEAEKVNKKEKNMKSTLLLLFLSFLGLFIGARLVIFSIENIGLLLNIPAAYLTLSTVSIATSLPEIAVTVSAARKKDYMIGLGNILGTNVMNVSLILGLSGFAGYYAIDTSLYFVSLSLFFISSFILSFAILRNNFSSVYGYLFLLLYAFYLSSFLVVGV